MSSLPELQKLEKEEWFTKKWRPAMAWSYMGICLFDFIIAPILWSILQASYKGNITEAWQPLTLQGAGLFHLAMGAILGVTAWSRGQEKMTMMDSTRRYSSSSQQYPTHVRERDFDPEMERDFSPSQMSSRREEK